MKAALCDAEWTVVDGYPRCEGVLTFQEVRAGSVLTVPDALQPEDLVTAFAVGFITVAPVIAVVFGGRALLSFLK